MKTFDNKLLVAPWDPETRHNWDERLEQLGKQGYRVVSAQVFSHAGESMYQVVLVKEITG